MKFRNFLGVSRTAQQSYYKDGVELIYPSQNKPLRLAILPAYDPMDPDPTGWVPAVTKDEESDFYCTVRAAKFVGHGNRRAKVSFLSPRTFDLNADDPYEAFYDFVSSSDEWGYLTKDRRGKRLSGEVEGAIFPAPKNFFVANVMDVTAGSRGGVFVTELSESVGKSILYSLRRNGTRVDGIAFAKDEKGDLIYGDITDPSRALVIEVAYGNKGYVGRPALDQKGCIMTTVIPHTLLQHRHHMEEPGTFIMRPESGQAIVDRLAGMLRGYKSDKGNDEIFALKEAMEFAYGDKYSVDEDAEEKGDPFSDAAKKTADAEPEQKANEVEKAVKRGVDRERYEPVKPKPIIPDGDKVKPMTAEPYRDDEHPGEDIDPSDIAAVRAMLSGGNK